MFHLQRDGSEHPQHPESADHGVKQIRVLIGAACDQCASRQHGSEFQYMLADRTYPKIIFPMDIRGKTAAQRGLHRARDDRGPPPIRFDFLPQLFERDAGLASHQAGSWFPFDDLVHAGHIEYDPAAVEGSVVITEPRAARSDGQPVFLGKLKGFINIVCGSDANTIARGFERMPKVFKIGERVERE